MAEEDKVEGSGSKAEEPAAEGAGTNGWDFLTSFSRELIAIGALVFLTIVLIKHYDDVKDATAVLGFVVPVLGAALGATLGYAGGEAQGKADKADAVKDGRKDLARQIKPKLEQAGETNKSVAGTIRESFPSREGTRNFSFEAGSGPREPIVFDGAALDDAQRSLDHVRGILDAVERE